MKDGTGDPLAPSLAPLQRLLCGLVGQDVQTRGDQRSEKRRGKHREKRVQLSVSPRTQALPRPVLTPTHLVLPEDLDDPLRQRAAIAHAAAHLLFSQAASSARTLKPMTVTVASAIEDARVERLMMQRYPGIRRWWLASLAPTPDPNDLSFSALLTRMDRALMDPHVIDDNYWVNKARRLFEQAVDRHGLHDGEALRAVASILANDLGQMRVRFDPRHHIVPSTYRDDNTFLWDFGDADQPPDDEITLLSQGARPPPPPPPPSQPSPARSADDDHEPDGASPRQDDLELARYSYPEWDHRLERMRPDWCTVIERLPAWQSLAPSSAVTHPPSQPVSVLKRQSARGRRLRRQWEGDDLDLDSVVHVMVDRRLSLLPEPRLFTRAGPARKASSILVLLDLSASSGDRRNGSHHSLLDIEKQAALMLADSINDTNDRLAIHGFSSNTRAEVNYYRLVDFGVLPGAESRAMIASLQARYSTRIGAALRHATALLREEKSTSRSILLITDGEPSDVDVFHAGHLTEDARRAVLEARRFGIGTYCVAVDDKVHHALQRIFGWRHHSVAREPGRLPTQLRRALARLA